MHPMLLTTVGAAGATASVATAAAAARVVASRIAAVLGIAALRAIRAEEVPIVVHIACRLRRHPQQPISLPSSRHTFRRA